MPFKLIYLTFTKMTVVKSLGVPQARLNVELGKSNEAAYLGWKRAGIKTQLAPDLLIFYPSKARQVDDERQSIGFFST